MIRPININLNAAHPELPLVEATTFTGAPSSVFIRGVPKAVGNWSITAVTVAVTYPDNTTTARAAVESAEGVWVATIPGTATSGRTAAGFKIMADGIDENGAAVTGYVLGFADFAVLSFFPVPAPGETFFYLRYFDTMPTAAKKMDVTTIDGVLKYFNGATWLPFATLDDAVTPTSANGVKSSGIWSAIWGALSALPTGFTSLYDWCVAQLAGKQDALSTQQIANIAAVSDALAFDATHSYAAGDPVVYNGTLYTFTAAHSGAWTGNDVSAVNALALIQALQSGKLDSDGLTNSNGGYLSAAGLKTNSVVEFSSATLNQPMNSGAALTDSDISDSASPLGTAFAGKASRAPNPTADNLAALDSDGNPTDSGWTAGDLARYALTTKTISNNAVTLDDRAINAVAVSSSLASLTVNFPTATSGKVRDFGLRLTVASGVTTAPQLVLPQGVTCENADGAAPEIGADGAATILYFTETAAGVFLVKGETVQTIS